MVARIYADTVTFEPPAIEEWQEGGACLSTDPDLFFEKKGEEVAKEICESCPVRIKCLAYALSHEKKSDQRWGVFGGLDGPERRKLQKQLNEHNLKAGE